MNLVEITNLSKHFSGVKAVSDISFNIEEKTINVVIGPNGAGKSTLFNMIGGLIMPSSGQIRFCGEDITNMPAYLRVRRGIGKSFQLVSLFPQLTVREHFITAQVRDKSMFHKLTKHEKEEIEKYIEQIDMQQYADVQVKNLPISEQRRLDVGLLLALKPKLLLLDEPFAGLFGNQIDVLKEIIVNARREVAILIVEHRLSIAMEIADRILVQAAGKLIFSGTPEEVRNSEVVRQSYLITENEQQ